MDRLEALLDKLPQNFPGRDALEAELDRADVLDPQDMPADVVTMNSTVRFSLQGTENSQTLTLVYSQGSRWQPGQGFRLCHRRHSTAGSAHR